MGGCEADYGIKLYPEVIFGPVVARYVRSRVESNRNRDNPKRRDMGLVFVIWCPRDFFPQWRNVDIHFDSSESLADCFLLNYLFLSL